MLCPYFNLCSCPSLFSSSFMILPDTSANDSQLNCFGKYYIERIYIQYSLCYVSMHWSSHLGTFVSCFIASDGGVLNNQNGSTRVHEKPQYRVGALYKSNSARGRPWCILLYPFFSGRNRVDHLRKSHRQDHRMRGLYNSGSTTFFHPNSSSQSI